MIKKKFTTHSRSWYGKTQQPDHGAVDEIYCSVEDTEKDVYGYFSFTWHELQGLSVKLTVWEDGFALFAYIRDLLDTLQDDIYGGFSVEEMEMALKDTGFVDNTKTIREGDLNYYKRKERELTKELAGIQTKLKEIENKK